MSKEDSLIIKLLKADPCIRVIHECRLKRKLYWNHDTSQWEVYSREEMTITFHYTGKSLVEALAALKVRE